ncbi:MAG: hypothetical protein ABI670_03255 [Chloroflexota bacterium]
MLNRWQARPGAIAGIFGMVLVAALYMAHALLLRATGHGLGAPWLLLLLLPGVPAAHLSRRAGASIEREVLFAGLLTAHFAALLQVTVLALAVLNVDWAAYSLEVGPAIGNGVRDMAIPAAVVASLVVIAVTYTGCIAAVWLGAMVYARVTNY